jgi:hypothetical protein
MKSLKLASVAVLALVSVALLAAWGDDPTPTPIATAVPNATPTPAVDTSIWDGLVTAALAEGTLNVISGFSTQAQISGFQEAFPGITVNFTQLRAPDLVARLPGEQSAGVFEWDIVHIGGSGGVDPTIPRTLFETVRDKLVLPELLADETYIGGFANWWVDDDEQQYKLHHRSSASRGSFFDVNRNVAPGFDSADDFFKPEFKGEICSFDPRIESGTDSALAQMMAMFGEKEQHPTSSVSTYTTPNSPSTLTSSTSPFSAVVLVKATPMAPSTAGSPVVPPRTTFRSARTRRTLPLPSCTSTGFDSVAIRPH